MDPGQARSGTFHRGAVRHCRAVVAGARVGPDRYAGTHPELDPNRAGNPKLDKPNCFGTSGYSRPNTAVESSECSEFQTLMLVQRKLSEYPTEFYRSPCAIDGFTNDDYNGGFTKLSVNRFVAQNTQ